MNTQQQLLARFLLAPQKSNDSGLAARVRLSAAGSTSRKLKQAAVLIPLVPRNNSYNVVLTRRADHLKHHPGQIAFPGGRYESEDVDLIDTAIRETKEETGILCNRESILGHLPSLSTISGYIVTPYVSTISANYTPTLDKNEVDELFEVPIEYLLNPMNIRSSQFVINGSEVNIYSISFHNHAIWGATAQMVKLLSKQLWY
ncbi:Putative nudix hydrolase YeaB [Photobacterium marinum]|uniref:Putative nudix hydrolase YeaB n=1 Tax=Photobacterium marinum TaxID=1056511 RepID=L8JGZ6_9GAMM|nr:CoA pyrophosphatase [Photobacterium marinum]ELR67533.1 Putative nudix hydrolase YeaB [Photobacterium marinum]